MKYSKSKSLSWMFTALLMLFTPLSNAQIVQPHTLIFNDNEISMATDFDPTSDITVDYRGETIVLSDQDAIPAELKGYVQAAINLSLINVEFDIEQGAFGLEPTLTATFTPDAKISRVHYAVLAGRLYDYYLN